MTAHKVICWNSAGIRASAGSTADKMLFFQNQFPRGDFSIAAFIETHHKNREDLPEDLIHFEISHHLIHTPTHNETHAGIVVLLSNLISNRMKRLSLGDC